MKILGESGAKPKPPPRFTPAAGPGYTAAQVANPNDPNVAAALAKLNPSGQSSLGYSGPAISGPAATDPYSVDGDPILAKIRAGNETARTNARAQALAQAKTLAIQFGDATGLSTDPAAQAEAAANPYSTLATLLKGYKDTGLAHDEALNQNNLFYSGARAKTLTEDAGNYQHGVYDARNAALGAYGGIQSNLATALTGADTADTNALGDAYGRATQRAAAYGIDPGQQNAVTNTDVAQPPPAAMDVSPTAAALRGFDMVKPYLAKIAPKPPVVRPNAYLTSPGKRG